MSKSVDNIECPICGGCALREQDHNTFEIYSFCTEPGCPYDNENYDICEDNE